MPYARRSIDDELDELLTELPALAIEGPRGVGKTTTALQRVDHVINLDDPAHLEVIEADLRELEPGPGSILIDEWQRLPSVWDYVRRAVDKGAPAGRFLLTGSSLPVHAPGHTGAGRIVSARMRPLSLAERGVERQTASLRHLLTGTTPKIHGTTEFGVEAYVSEILASGFPGIRPLSPRSQKAQLDSYLTYALTHEVTGAGRSTRSADSMRRWLRAYAAASSTTTSYNAILDAATAGESDKPARSTVEGFRNALTQLWLLEPTPGWVPYDNELEKLTQAPKHQLVDPALAARILNLDADDLLRRSTATTAPKPAAMLGPLLESLVTLSIQVYAQANQTHVGHLRTYRGQQEIDLIVEGRSNTVLAVETKLSATVEDSDVKHLLWLKKRLGRRLLDMVILTTGSRAYRRADGVAVIPAVLLGP